MGVRCAFGKLCRAPGLDDALIRRQVQGGAGDVSVPGAEFAAQGPVHLCGIARHRRVTLTAQPCFVDF